MSVPLATIRNLSVAYDGETALNGLSFDIPKGGRLAIIGESGSGKSSFARALSGLLPANAALSGEIGWPGFEDRQPQAGRDLCLVLQDPATSLDPVMTIGRQVAEGARAHLGLAWPQAMAQAENLLARVRLPELQRLMHAFPHQLSGGQRQRVAIAAALASRPRLLIADEITSALDMVTQAEIVTLLRDLTRDSAMTLVFITHDIALASTLCDRCAVFHRGRLVEIGPMAEVLARPGDAYTATLIGAHIDLASPRLIEHFQEKWEPVFRPEMRQGKESGGER